MQTIKIKVLLAALFLLTAALLSGHSYAQLAGKNTILVHGLQTLQLLQDEVSSQQVSRDGEAYWEDIWGPLGDDRLDWSAKSRLDGDTAQRAYDKVIEWASTGFCDAGCIFVTHSTGDLVTRYVLDNQDIWTEAAGLQPLNVLAVLDFAGAGGGSELAQLALDVSGNRNWLTAPILAAVEAFLGFRITNEELGVLEDLRPTVARQTATAPNSVPRLRFVGGGNEFLGVTGPFLPGTDDGVVTLASACGGVNANGVDSCVNNRTLSGRATSVSAPPALLVNHYPVLMGDSTGHLSTISDRRGDELSYVFSSVQGDFAFELPTQRSRRGFWPFRSTYYTVRGSNNQPMSEVFISSVR